MTNLNTNNDETSATEGARGAVQRAEEELAAGEAWKELVKEVLSTARIDPQTRGKSLEMFSPFTGEVTEQHVHALQLSNYGQCFRQFLSLWQNRPNRREIDDITEGVELFKRLSQVTHSVFREIQHQQKGKAPLGDEDILRKAVFLTNYYWDSNHSNFEVSDVSEQLELYLDSGIEWRHLEKRILAMSVRRAYDLEMERGKTVSQRLTDKWFGNASVAGVLVSVIFRAVSYMLPRVLGLAISVLVLWWCLNNLDAAKHPVISLLGLYWVAITTFATLMHYGTYEIRHNIRRLLRRPFAKWNEFEPFIDADLHAMNSAINRWRISHINLRLVREQLTRLQHTPIEFPIQVLTMIDRSIAKGVHSW